MPVRKKRKKIKHKKSIGLPKHGKARTRQQGPVRVDDPGCSVLADSHLMKDFGEDVEQRKFPIYKIEDGITQSILNSWLNCRRSAEFSFNGWKQPKIKTSLTYGSIFHDLLEKLYDGVIKGEIDQHTDFSKFAKKQGKLWIKKHADRYAGPGEYEEAVWQVHRACAIFEVYCEIYIKGDLKKDWQAVEGTFDVQFKRWRLRGRRDGEFQRKGKLWLLETKTKGRIDENAIMTKVNFDFQSLFYLLTMEIETGCKPQQIAGVLYNVIRNPSLKLTQKESQRAHLERIQADARERPDHYFMRYEATFDVPLRERFKKELENKLIEFEAWMKGLLPTYPREGGCIGIWHCSFLSACASGTMSGYVNTGRMFEELE